jgi:transitional endoplasmic reticulum ATPase
MLNWMDGHAFPFACTTNLVERLDRASLRRFLVKVGFDWLTVTQARLAFRRFFGQSAPPELDALQSLTPADFALVRRRVAMHSCEPHPQTALRLLKAECEGRITALRPIGFTRRATAG